MEFGGVNQLLGQAVDKTANFARLPPCTTVRENCIDAGNISELIDVLKDRIALVELVECPIILL